MTGLVTVGRAIEDDAAALAAQDPPGAVPCVIRVDGEPAGRIDLNNVVRGAFWSADLGCCPAARRLIRRGAGARPAWPAG